MPRRIFGPIAQHKHCYQVKDEHKRQLLSTVTPTHLSHLLFLDVLTNIWDLTITEIVQLSSEL